GMAIFLKAIYRGTVVLLVPNYAQIKVDAKFCLLNPIVLCDIYAFGADAILLLANSIDRLLVVSVPLKYYVHAKYIVLWEILVTHSITISTFAITVFICASNNNDTASIECRKTSYFPESFGARIAWARALLSTTSILTMGAVLLKSRTYGKGNIAFVTDRKLATFKRRQQKFTRLTIASSIVTF
uniref:G-protein coupled receptors family 1 profile domain-containing protein n=1 Tax=Parascaris univalens TaxID=6257 RepID=A0A915AR04_PARUN